MHQPQNAIIVIFGASGDLTYRKLIPSLFSLKKENLLPEKYAILGVSHSKFSNTEFREKMKEGIHNFSKTPNIKEEEVSSFTENISYLSIDMENPEEYEKLKKQLQQIVQEKGIPPNYIFHLAIPPILFESVVSNIRNSGLNNQDSGYRRIIVEKPFGFNLESGIKLNKCLHASFPENQIFRIDHYLGKETVQNILVTRFANGIFEPLWNRNYIHHIEISSSESIGVGNRGRYYETSGALRDMVQNHLLQMVCITAMEPPSSMESNAIRNETLKVLQSLRPIKEEEVEKYIVRGQYTKSHIKGEEIAAYREEKGIAPDSRTETYVAVKFYIDNWRWGGVPFYIRTGKRLPTRVTEIVIHFKATPHFLFSLAHRNEAYNQLIIRIQPDEGILLKFGMKYPGTGFNIKNVNMNFSYEDLGPIKIHDPYTRLLYDAMTGDSTLFSRGDVIEAAWKFIEPIQKAWDNNPNIKIYGYAAGTWGPKKACDLFEEKEMDWRYPCKNLTNEGEYCEL